jgi:hypothetical protein
MHIIGSQVSMASSHYMHKEQSVEEHFRFWIGDTPPSGEANQSQGAVPLRDTVTLSREGQTRAAEREEFSINESPEESETAIDSKMQVIRRIMEAFTGKRIKVAEVASDNVEEVEITETGHAPQNQREGWGLEYDYQEEYYEIEQMKCAATGTVVTADGREISFSLEVAMNREFHESTSLIIRAGDARLVDPLVINYDGQAADLTDTRFSFDLDGDGTDEDISFAGPGSGFLVFDRNEDGKINNGFEMFGPQTGHGFAELADYDIDANGWLDEGDPLYANLKIWAKDADGADQFFSLKEKDIGAIYLSSIATPFSLESAPGILAGRVKAGSIFIRADGSAGTVQEIDLAV